MDSNYDVQVSFFTVLIMASFSKRSQQRPLSTQIEPVLKAKSTITSRMRENEGKFIRQLELKDQEIIELKKRLKDISEQRKRQSALNARYAFTVSLI